MNRIIVIDDDIEFRVDLSDYLAAKGFSVVGVDFGINLQDILKDPKPDVIVLDKGANCATGFILASEIRKMFDLNCGIIMVSAHDSPEDRIKGLESGADIYLVKPVGLREIEANVRSLLRRMRAMLDEPEEKSDCWALNLGTWRLTPPGGTPIKLTGSEMYFVETLIRKAGHLCSRDELTQALRRPLNRQDDRNLDALVRRLRRKIKEEGDTELPIKMVYGTGYVFTADAMIIH
ncbi:response regulator transcription factor [Telmatospirillum siberiense]|uniref:DNA-binding response regulator n=1 Tax=Telmatospirillum siberiense TaxID=382514 RepID=A0A2N3PZB0_9PROT|nr:response regulator transcription factor [Telmatospirillum siberiense]PKU25747.1 DNA-binding response regulator [Telmatospirillum siberiense]